MVRLPLSLRHAGRNLRKAPRLFLICLLTLAVGIAAATVVFSLVDGILLRPLPYPEADRLFGLWLKAPGLNLPQIPQSPGSYFYLRDHGDSLEGLALYRRASANLSHGSVSERVGAAAVTDSLFGVLGVAPAHGRTFAPEEVRPGGPSVVILSDGLWRRRFGGALDVVGSSVRVEGVEHQVVGIMPPGFAFPTADTRLWRPLPLDPGNAPLGEFGLPAIARLAEGRTVEQARADLDRLLAGLPEVFRDDTAQTLADGGISVLLKPLKDDLVGNVEGLLWILFGCTGLVLLIASSNVANLLLVRGEERRQDSAIHTALGASRRRLLETSLLEAVLVGAVAGGLGLALAAVGLRFLVQWSPIQLPRLNEVGLDLRILGFALGVGVLASIVSALWAALRAIRSDKLLDALRSGSRAAEALSRGSRRVLVGIQLTLALVLMAASVLMLRSSFQMSRVDPGFNARDLLVLDVSLPEPLRRDPAAAGQLMERVVEDLTALPGVSSVGMSSSLPLSGQDQAAGYEAETSPLAPGEPPPVLGVTHVAPDYFETMGIPLIRGRSLEPSDVESDPHRVVVSTSAARRLWPQGSPLGQRLRVADSEDPQWFTVVGVVGDVHQRRLTDEPVPRVYHLLSERAPEGWQQGAVGLAVRSSSPPEPLIESARERIHALSPELVLTRSETMVRSVRRSGRRMRFSTLLFLAATLIALTLGAVGMYAFIAYLVSRRTGEIGVRMAMGARPGDIRRLVLREALGLAVVGCVVGLFGAWLTGRWMESLLFGVSPFDPLTFVLVPLLLVALVLFASLSPANRAARLDPVRALRQS